MKCLFLPAAFPCQASFFAARIPHPAFLLALALVCALGLSPGCGGGSGGDPPTAVGTPAGQVRCPCIADVYIDEWSPLENLNYETDLLVATNTNIHHGISRSLLKFEIPAGLKPADVKEARLYFSGCSHCGTGGYGGLVRLYALTIPFNENTSTWKSLDGCMNDEGSCHDETLFSEVDLPAGKSWNEAVNGEPPPDAAGFDITALLQGNLDKARDFGFLMRYADEHQQPAVHTKVASRESADLRDFPPFLLIRTGEDPLQVVEAGEDFEPFTAPGRPLACGPYSLRVKQNSAILAWEEEQTGAQPRHVESPALALEPDTEYRYLVNGAAGPGRFRTAPLADPTEPPSFRFFVWGDSRADAQVSGAVLDSMLALDPDASFALHTGDMVGNGDLLENWLSQWWGPMAALLRRLPVYPTMGNHEIDSPWYRGYFSSLGGGGSNYSFDFGNLHFVVLDSNSVNFGGEAQLAWLTGDLGAHREADFTLLTMHIPAFAASPSGSTGAGYLQERLVPLLEEHGVDAVFSGDVHSYQHHRRNGIHYFISAGGGEAPSDPGLPLPGLTLGLGRAYHYLHCRVEGRSLDVTAFDPRGNTLDHALLTSGAPYPVSSSARVDADKTEVTAGETFRLDLYLQDVQDLERVAFRLDCYRDEPALGLEVTDEDPLASGIQVSPGDLGGTVTRNETVAPPGRIEYREEAIGGLSAASVKVASATLRVPANAGVTAFYLVPSFALSDTADRETPLFLGGVQIAVQANG